MPKYKYHVFICTHERDEANPKGSCGKKGSAQLCKQFKEEVRKYPEINNIRINPSGCLDQCEQGPSVVVYPEQTWYTIHHQSDIEEIVQKHFLQKIPVERLFMKDRKE